MAGCNNSWILYFHLALLLTVKKTCVYRETVEQWVHTSVLFLFSNNMSVSVFTILAACLYIVVGTGRDWESCNGHPCLVKKSEELKNVRKGFKSAFFCNC